MCERSTKDFLITAVVKNSDVGLQSLQTTYSNQLGHAAWSHGEVMV